MEKESPDSPEMEKDSPDSPEEGEIFFIEDRRPGKVPSPLMKNSLPEKAQLNGSIDSEEFIVLDSFVDSGASSLPSVQGDIPIENGDSEASGSEDNNQLAEDLCLVVEDRNPQLTGQEIQIPRYTINVSRNFLPVINPSNKI